MGHDSHLIESTRRQIRASHQQLDETKSQAIGRICAMLSGHADAAFVVALERRLQRHLESRNLPVDQRPRLRLVSALSQLQSHSAGPLLAPLAACLGAS